MRAALTRIAGASALLAVACTCHPGLAAAAPDAWSLLEVRGGTASFDAPTTVASINVHGKSTELDARADVRDSADGLSLESVEATLPVKSLATGMGVRDAHMRKLVFTSSDGTLPDVTFASRGAVCTADPAKRQSACIVSGELAIRGIPRSFTMTLTVSRDGRAFHASGDGLLKLSAYGIEQPAEFGVRVSDAVKLHLDFTARPAAEATTQSGSR